MTSTPERRPVKEASVKTEHTPKLCECGCGEPAPIATMTNRSLGYVKGQPRSFVNGHQNRRREKVTYTPLYRRFVITDTGLDEPCWLWTMSLDGRGYGQMWDREKRTRVTAHRFLYEHIVGPVPEGLDLDHLCRVRHCVNPAHLEPVTRAENVRRGFVFRREQRRLQAEGRDK